MSVVSVNTFVHTAGYLAANLDRSLTDIIKGVGLDPGELAHETIEHGLKVWIDSGDLEAVHLEIFSRLSDQLVGRFSFDINYTYTSGDGTFWLDSDLLKFAIRKHGLIPSGCSYRVVATTADGRPDVEGWSKTTLRSIAGMTRNSVGAAIGAGSAAAGLAYYSRS